MKDSFWDQRATVFGLIGPITTPDTARIAGHALQSGALAQMVAWVMAIEPAERWRYSITTDNYPSFSSTEVDQLAERNDFPPVWKKQRA